MSRSNGQARAFEQLNEIIAASRGDISVVDIKEPSNEASSLIVRLSVSTDHLEQISDGFQFNAREPIILRIPNRFPIERPSVSFVHKRFKGFPHVQWGNQICLYVAPDVEWIPSDGMYGFIQRFNDWLKAAATNNLDPENAPLHPPVVYATSDIRIVASKDTPVILNNEVTWIGAAHLVLKNKYTYEIQGWTKLGEELPDNVKFGASLLLTQPMPMEYPDTVLKLLSEFEKNNVSFPLFYELLRYYSLLTEKDDDLYFVVGAPMRRKQAGGDIKQHLATWKVPASSLNNLRDTFDTLADPDNVETSKEEFIKWAVTAKIEWCDVYENRAEVTTRRDVDTEASWLSDKRVLLLGCGALGSFIAEFITKAGAKKITLVDNSLVNPGILVRQQYRDRSIGFTKTSALKVLLDELGSSTEIVAEYKNLKFGIFDKFDSKDYDVIFDATASKTVAIVLENELKKLSLPPPIASFAISAKASSGMVTVRMPKFTGGPLDIDRKAKIECLKRNKTRHFVKNFWPSSKELKLFQPEPGCSEPTFVASAADIAFHSSTLLLTAIRRIQTLKVGIASADLVSKPPFILDTNNDRYAAFEFNGGKKLQEVKFKYQTLTSSVAINNIESEVKRNNRIRGEYKETGGLLFGSIDDSLERIWIDTASGPPADSYHSPELFECGTEGTKVATNYQKKTTAGSSSFIGIWHTHPISPPKPSSVDIGAMLQMLLFQEEPPRHVVMLIIGYARTKPVWKFYLFRRNEFGTIIQKEIKKNGK